MSMCISTGRAFRLGGLAQDGGLSFGFSEVLVLLARRAHNWALSMLDMFSSAWQAWHFLNVAKTLAGVGQNGRWFWRSFCVAWTWTTFWKVQSRFAKLSSVLIFDMLMIPCGRCSTSDASSSFVVAGDVHCRPRPKKCSWELYTVVGETCNINVHFSWCPQ